MEESIEIYTVTCQEGRNPENLHSISLNAAEEIVKLVFSYVNSNFKRALKITLGIPIFPDYKSLKKRNKRT